MANEFIGRRTAVGFGIETTPGTPRAAQQWFKHLSLDFYRRTKTVQNESAMNRVEKVNASEVTQQWAEGKLDGKLQDISIGYLLLDMFGSVSAANHAGETTVKDHTFTVSQLNNPVSLTVTRKDPLTDRQHALAAISSIEFKVDSGDFVKISGNLVATAGTNGTDTVAFTAENEFTSKHTIVKLATNVAGLTGATAQSLKSLSLKLERKVDPFFPFNSLDPTSMYTGAWEASGSMTARYTDTTLENLAFANTQQALSIDFKNTDVTIGSAANPELLFTAPQVRLSNFKPTNDLDKVIEQSVDFYAELNSSAAAAITAILTNTQTAYA